MKFLAPLALAMAACAMPAPAAVYDFSYSANNAFNGNPFSGSGTFITQDSLTTSAGGRDGYLITGVTGTQNGNAILGLTGFLGANNLLFTTGTLFDASGVSFSVAGAGGATSTNLIFGSFSQAFQLNVTPFQIFSNATVSVRPSAAAAVPEPATWAMMLAGFGLVGAAARRRRIAAQAA